MKKDFHGLTLDEAVQTLHNIVGEIRNNNETEDAILITGRGPIRKEVIRLLKEYKLKPEVQLGNTGVVVVMID